MAAPPNSSAFNPDDYSVIIGIDFGTTFSGCCYALTQNKDVIDITKWPKQNSNVYPKTPTLAFYKRGSRELVDWGHGARRAASKPNTQDHVLLSKFKLYLDENLHLEPLPNSLNVVEVIGDYLRAFHGHVTSELQKGFAGNYDPTKFRYCLTVPAMWSDRAKTATRQAAILAGIISPADHPERLMLISEPEAAALYCERKSDQFNLTSGQRFMICDAGGGTVDLIVFEIDQRVEGGPRTLKEVTKGHGGSCGSTFLDEKMRTLLRRKFWAHIAKIPETAFEMIMDNFVDLIKPEFDGYEDHFLQLPAAMGLGDMTDDAIGVESGVLHLPAEELRNAVFEPVIQQVLTLIEGQLQQSPRLEAIFLVGGFGQSNYLFRRVEETFGNRVGMIGVPPRGELAVVRGAVYFGLNPQTVTERVSRRSYGVETRMLYQPGLDPIEYSVVGADNRLFCRQRFSVYVQKGQSVKVDEVVSKNFVITYPNDTDSDLYAYDGDGIPPRLTTNQAVRKVASFPIKMPVLPGIKHGDKVNMTIRMYFGLTEIKIECIIRDRTFVFTSAFDASDAFGANTTAIPPGDPGYNAYPAQAPGAPVPGYLPTPNVAAAASPSPYAYQQQQSQYGRPAPTSQPSYQAPPQTPYQTSAVAPSGYAGGTPGPTYAQPAAAGQYGYYAQPNAHGGYQQPAGSAPPGGGYQQPTGGAPAQGGGYQQPTGGAPAQGGYQPPAGGAQQYGYQQGQQQYGSAYPAQQGYGYPQQGQAQRPATQPAAGAAAQQQYGRPGYGPQGYGR